MPASLLYKRRRGRDLLASLKSGEWKKKDPGCWNNLQRQKQTLKNLTGDPLFPGVWFKQGEYFESVGNCRNNCFSFEYSIRILEIWSTQILDAVDSGYSPACSICHRMQAFAGIRVASRHLSGADRCIFCRPAGRFTNSAPLKSCSQNKYP
jgi:hypothetical protein